MARDDAAPKTSKFIALASVCVVVGALYLAREVMIPLAVAILLTFLLAPLVHRIERLRVPRVPAVLIAVIFSFVLIGLFGWLVSSQLRDLADKIVGYRGEIAQRIDSIRNSFGHGPFARLAQTIDQEAQHIAASSQPDGTDAAGKPPAVGTAENPMSVVVTSTQTSAYGKLQDIEDALSSFAPVAKILIIIVLVIFMLVQREDLRDRMIRLVGQGQLTITTQALDDAAGRVSRYLLAQSMINGAYGLAVGIGLFVLHVPNAPLWGLLCAVLRFIPYVGVWIGALFPIILSLVAPGGYFARPILTIALFAGLELVVGNVIEPMLYGSSTGVSSMAILVAAVFWTWLWGGVGLLLSTPLTVVLAVMGKYVPQMAFLDVLLGDQPVLEPYERYYQRLLADDAEEAEDLIEDFGKTHTTEETYRMVLLPAMQTAERDKAQGRLEAGRHEFILQSIKDHIETERETFRVAEAEAEKKTDAERLKADAQRAADLANGATTGEKKDATASQQAADAIVARPFAIPKDCTVNVLCLAAHDEADEIASLMLSHLLEEQGYCTHTVSSHALASEMVESVEKLHADIVVVSALPPGALAHARYICKRLHAKYPEMRIVVGLWNAKGDLAKARSRIASAESVEITATFPDVLRIVHQMAQPLLIRAGEGEGAKEEESAGKNGVGTAGGRV
jgi:predicted PurR-regulated permease PerM